MLLVLITREETPLVKVAAEHWLTTGEVARVLGCNHKWVLTLVEQGAIRSTQTPHGHIYHPLEILRVRQRRQDDGKQPPTLDEQLFPAEVLEAFYEEMKGNG
jgi:excisionase family DNA binding protein